jgi:hypothetical protein
MRGAVHGDPRLSQQLQAGAETQSSQRMKSTGSTAARGIEQMSVGVGESQKVQNKIENNSANAKEQGRPRRAERSRRRWRISK